MLSYFLWRNYKNTVDHLEAALLVWWLFGVGAGESGGRGDSCKLFSPVTFWRLLQTFWQIFEVPPCGHFKTSLKLSQTFLFIWNILGAHPSRYLEAPPVDTVHNMSCHHKTTQEGLHKDFLQLISCTLSLLMDCDIHKDGSTRRMHIFFYIFSWLNPEHFFPSDCDKQTNSDHSVLILAG